MRLADLLINQLASYKGQSQFVLKQRLEICKHGGEAYVSFCFRVHVCVKSDMHAHGAKACKTGMGGW